MKWLKTNGTTLAMALVLSLVTVGLLTDPEQDETRRTPNVRFSPDIRSDVRSTVGSLEFWVNDNRHTDYIPVAVSGNETDVQSALQNLICQPVIDRARFPDDPAARETKFGITAKDFNLPADLVGRIRIRPFELKITFAPLWRTKLPIEVSPAAIEDAKDSRYRVDAVRAVPPSIFVQIPVDKLSSLTSLPIRPLRIEGRTKSFVTEGSLNLDLPDMKDVKRLENFFIEVDLSLIQSKIELEGIPLHLSAPPIPGHTVELIDKLAIKVAVEGPEDLLKALREKPEHIHVYVKLDLKNWTLGNNSLEIRCEVPEQFRKNQVRVSLAPGAPILAQVMVTKS